MAQDLQPLTLAGHKSGVNVCSFSPDGKTFLSGSKDGTVRVWDIESNYNLQKVITIGHTSISSLHYNNKGDYFSIGNMQSLQIYKSSNFNRIARKKKAHETYVKAGNFSPDDKFIVSSSWKGKALMVWEVKTLNQRIELGESNWTDDAIFTPDGNYIISCNHDNNVKVWDLKTGNITRIFAGHTDWVYGAKITSNMEILISGSLDKTIKLWDFKSGKHIITLTGHNDGISTIALSPNNQFIASGSLDGSIIIWDLNAKQEKIRLTEKGSTLLSLEFSVDGKSLASCEQDGTIRIWDISNLK